MILGIDEAGRGPWAGPLVVGAVVLGGEQIDGLTDSKKLTKKKREKLYDEITAKSKAYASGWVSSTELDKIGMSQALKLATRRAVEQINVSYSEIIIDGTVNFLADTGKGKYVQTMTKADLLIPSVSAASIIAKVERDRFMTKQSLLYPEYGFDKHSGYGTARHRAAIDEYGVTPLHRLSFAPLAKYRTAPLPSSQISPKSARRSLDAGPVARSAPTPRSQARLGVGATPPRATRLSITTKAIGDRAENIVAEHLESQGHMILARNWKTKICEIDIVSQFRNTIYFTEVKYRKNSKFGDGLEAITAKKQQQMRFAAELFMTKFQMFSKFDVSMLAASVSGEPPIVQDIIEIE